ncbi:MAG TPA: CPBP family glutamic-type intramembrane protease [Caulobacteraceae bacterium]|nr:CPBP family glutamic-type intramembrane protease [Caulobacteraceae bacterium]
MSAGVIASSAARLKRAVTTVPKSRDWIELLAVTTLVGAVAVPLGLKTGLLHYEPRSPRVIALSALIVILIPALGEELPFRGLMIPDRSETKRALWPILISTALFTCWHVVETQWQPKERALFTRPDFLAWAAWLGLWCAILRRRSGSIWSGVVLHWVTVAGWIGWLGGPAAS